MYFFWPRGLCEIIPETPRTLWTEKVGEVFQELTAEFQRPEVTTVMQSGCDRLGLYTLIESADISGVRSRRNPGEGAGLATAG